MNQPEQIVFVDEEGQPTGEVGPKLESHNANTRMHLAFSCYIFRKSDNKFLVTQRALSKKVWPGAWSNSVCGHPMPGEAIEDALRRRVLYEAGIKYLEDLTCVVPKYTYITPPYKGIVEHEFCPIFVAYTDDEPAPNSDEIEGYEWLDWLDYVKMLEQEADKMSYWAKDQYKRLKDLEPFRSLAQSTQATDYLTFIAFLGKAERLKSTLRHNWTTTGRQEDSAQHSWRAAIFFILMHEHFGLDADPYKTVMMLIFHDLPEAEYGDIAAFAKDNDLDGHTKHKERERQAARDLYAMLPSDLSVKLTELNEEFEAGETKEARVAKALERIESQLQHLESGTEYWSDEERGDHMLHYPDAAVAKLGDEHVAQMWKIIQREIYKLTYPDK